MKYVNAALKILESSSIPFDARSQIDLLYDKAGEREKPLFAMVYKALLHRENMSSSPTEDELEKLESLIDVCLFDLSKLDEEEVYSSVEVGLMLDRKTKTQN